MLPGFDASQFQGTNISFPQVKAAGYVFGFTRMTYAYPGQGVKIDPTASKNYYGMVSVGIQPGGYHKIGWTDPIAEADAFVNAMSPLAEGDLLAHDMEPASDVAIPTNWSEFEQAYVQRVHDRTGVWSLRYENISMNNSMPKEGVVVNSGSWVAAPSYSWNATLPVSTIVIFQQGPSVHIPGITANVCDTDAFFGTIDELKAYGYHNNMTVTPTVTPTPVTPVVTTPTVVTATPVVDNTVTSAVPVTQIQPPTVVPTPEVATVTTPAVKPIVEPVLKPQSKAKTSTGFWSGIINFFKRLFHL